MLLKQVKTFNRPHFVVHFLSRIPQKVVDVIFKKPPEDGCVCLLGCVITLGAPGHTNCARRGRRPTEKKPMLEINHQSLNPIKFENSPWESCNLCFEACQFICLRCYSVLQVLYQVRQLQVIMNFTFWLLRQIMTDEQMSFELNNLNNYNKSSLNSALQKSLEVFIRYAKTMVHMNLTDLFKLSPPKLLAKELRSVYKICKNYGSYDFDRPVWTQPSKTFGKRA